MELKEFFDRAFSEYERKNPIVKKVKSILEAEGEELNNDHIALRTWNRSPVRVEDLAKFFIGHGYEAKGKYDFTEKKLKAIHLEKNNKWPKVFISELMLEKMNSKVSKVFEDLKANVADKSFEELFLGEPLWEREYKTYQMLAEQSEYASWLYAHGFCANHFTVLVNNLKSFDSLSSLNQYLIEKGIELNESGGLIKGSPEALLEQSSTKAPDVEVKFQEGPQKIPGCYYEFALRYPNEEGIFFQGFVENSADKIFESTDRQG